MKKISVLLLLVMVFELLLVSCGPIVKDNVKDDSITDDNGVTDENNPEHEHIFSEGLVYDKRYHFYACECGERNGAKAHSFGEWITLKEASETEDGQIRRDCSECDYIELATLPGGNHQHATADITYDERTHTILCHCGEIIEKLPHTLSDWTVTEAATENAAGMKMRKCDGCDYQEFLSIPKIQKGETVFEWTKLTIQNVATSHYMNYDYGKLSNGTILRVWPFDGSNEQLFDISHVSGNTYRILTNSSSGFAVDVFRDGKALAEGMLCDIWQTNDATAQNIKLHLCDDGSYIFRMAKNMDLAIAAPDANGQLKLVKFNESDASQKWIFKDSDGKKVNIKDPMPTSVGIPEDCYELTGVVFAVDGNEYRQAVTTKEYNGVDVNNIFFVNKESKVVANAELINKLYQLMIFEDVRETCLNTAKTYGTYAKEYFEIYCNILATEKLGEIIGAGSGVLLKLGAGIPCALGEAAVEIVGDIDIETIKTTVLLSYLRIYTNNCEAYANEMDSIACDRYYDYDEAMKAVNAYIACVSSWAVVNEIAGDEVRELSGSSTAKELGKYFKNVFTSLADSIIPDIDSVKIAKFISDGAITLIDFYKDSGVMKAYETAENAWLARLDRDYEGAKAVADKLAVSVGVEGTKYVAAGLVEKLEAVKKKYPEGTKVSHSYVFPSTSAYECHGFACYALMYFWGTKKPGVSNTGEYKVYKATSTESYVNKIRPGDLVRFCFGSYDHTIVVTNVDDDNIYYADCNADLKCTFDYNKVISKADLANYLVKKLNSQQVSVRGYILHAKNNDL